MSEYRDFFSYHHSNMKPVSDARNAIPCGCKGTLCLLDDARAVAEDTGYVEQAVDIMYHVASFVSRANQRIRINVYYHTGTIGTVLDDPLNCGLATQLFRREVKSVPELRKIFQEPRIVVSPGYLARSHLVTNQQQRMLVKILQEPSSEKEELSKSLKAIKTSIKELETEKRQLQDALLALASEGSVTSEAAPV